MDLKSRSTLLRDKTLPLVGRKQWKIFVIFWESKLGWAAASSQRRKWHGCTDEIQLPPSTSITVERQRFLLRIPW